MPRDERYQSTWEENKKHRRKQLNGPIITSRQQSKLDQGIRNLPNFCKNGAMHTCDAHENGDRQKHCFFHSKSTGFNHCIDLRFDEYCGNQILHQYIAGGMNDTRATALVKSRKETLLKIQNKAEGYHVIFPLEGEETFADIQNIYDQLCALGLTTSEFWIDKNGKSASEYDSFRVGPEDIKNGTWMPKRKELIKDILKYFELREKLNH